MSKDAIQIALNALAVLEEQSPADSRRLRKLLPALAVDFAKAGRPVSERDLIDLIVETKQKGVALSTLFTSSKKKKGGKELSYADIARRLNKDYDDAPDGNRIQSFGLIEEFTHFNMDAGWKKEQFEALAVDCAHKGHTALCLHAVDRHPHRLYILEKVLHQASADKQTHLIYEIIESMTEDEQDALVDNLQRSMKEADRNTFSAFKRLLEDHKRSGPTEPEYFTGLEHWAYAGLRMTPYLQIREMLAQELASILERNQMAYKATILFQSPQRVLKFLDQFGTRSGKPLSNLLKQMDPPISSKHVDWSAWGDALLKYGPDMYYPLHFAKAVPAPRLGPDGKISLRKTRQAVWEKCFDRSEANVSLSELCFHWQVSAKNTSKAKKWWEERRLTEPRAHLRIPNIEFDCTELGLPGYKFQKLSHDDAHILMLGYYTGCCE
ncbi:MAG: hypothetical protein DI551_12365, partial [Micavibrio aeruginosavorus]